MGGNQVSDGIRVMGQPTVNGVQRTPMKEPMQQSKFGSVINHEVLQPQTTKEVRTAELRGNQVSINEEQLVKAIEKAVKSIQGPYTYLEFSVHEKTRQIAVKVLDRDTGEVIREIPPEKTLDFVAKLWEMAGILVDERR